MTGKNDNAPVIGQVTEDGESFVHETPEDIANFVEEQGIKEIKYVCTLKQWPLAGSEQRLRLPGIWKAEYPTPDEIGKRFGPGNYMYCFAWKEADENGKRIQRLKEYTITLGEHWADLYDEYMSEKYFEKEKRLETLKHKARLKRVLKGQDPDSAPEPRDGIENLKDSLEVLKSLGVPMAGQNGGVPANQGNDTMALMMGLQQQASQANMKMFMQMNQNMMTLMTAMMQSNRQPSNKDHFGEIVELLKGTMDLKEILSPEKKGVVDKVFELMESVLPSLLTLAQRPREERVKSPLMGVAKSSAEWQELEKDPAMLDELVAKWDAAHGTKQTDIILATVGWRRGSESPTAGAPLDTEIEDVTEVTEVPEPVETEDEPGEVVE